MIVWSTTSPQIKHRQLKKGPFGPKNSSRIIIPLHRSHFTLSSEKLISWDHGDLNKIKAGILLRKMLCPGTNYSLFSFLGPQFKHYTMSSIRNLPWNNPFWLLSLRETVRFFNKIWSMVFTLKAGFSRKIPVWFKRDREGHVKVQDSSEYVLWEVTWGLYFVWRRDGRSRCILPEIFASLIWGKCVYYNQK